jgi:ABC-type lipoprotein export system ATPase subunit
VTIVVISHDREIAARMGRRIEVLDGRIVFDGADTFGGSSGPAHGDAAHDEATRP